jgi:hypothetical protein
VLVLTDQDGASRELATSKSSGFAPYSAVFTALLDKGDAALAASALNGAHGRLFVEYRAHLDQTTPIQVSLSGDVTTEVAAAHSPLSSDDARALLQTALAANHVTLSRRGPQTAPDEVWSPLENQVLAAAAEDLQNLTKTASNTPAPPTQAFIAHDVSGEYRISDTFTRRADIADWFADGSGPEHIRVLDVPQAGRR